jgi:hypothetical protein
MKYTVKYKHRSHWFWRTVKNVKADAVVTDLGPKPVRVLVLENEGRVEIPLEDTEFRFSHERFMVIKKNAEREARQPLVTD